MKLLFVLFAVVAAVVADPEALRERRGVLAGPVLAPSAAIITPALGGVALAGHGPALVGPGAIIAGAPLARPWGGPAIWG